MWAAKSLLSQGICEEPFARGEGHHGTLVLPKSPSLLTCLASERMLFTGFMVSDFLVLTIPKCLCSRYPSPGVHQEQTRFFIELSLRMLSPVASGCLNEVCDFHGLQSLCVVGAGWEQQQTWCCTPGHHCSYRLVFSYPPAH